jgi:hypothetical protein
LRAVRVGGSQGTGKREMCSGRERDGRMQGTLCQAEGLECGALREQSALRLPTFCPTFSDLQRWLSQPVWGWQASPGTSRGADKVLEPSSCRSNRSWLRGR